jgi:hypothetical protein
MMRVRAIRAPVQNRKQGITLWHVGDEADVPDDGYWRGLVEDGAVMVVDETAEVQQTEAQSAAKPVRGKKRSEG